MDGMEFDPIIHDREAFERWLRDQQIEEGTIRSYVRDLKRFPRDLEIEVGPATIGNRDDADELADRLADKNIGKNLGDNYRSAARRYADFIQASKSAQEDDEMGFRKPKYPSTIERHRIVLELLRRMEMPVTKAQIGTAFADHLRLTSEQRAVMAPGGRIPKVDWDVGFVLSSLTHAGFLSQPRPRSGMWTLTEDGRRLPFEEYWQRMRERERRQKQEREQRRQRSEADDPANHDMSEADEKIEAEVDWREASEPYDVDSAHLDLFVSMDQLTRILDSIKRRKNLILQGPPGVGKTFIARRIAWCLIGRKDSNPVEMVQHR